MSCLQDAYNHCYITCATSRFCLGKNHCFIGLKQDYGMTASLHLIPSAILSSLSRSWHNDSGNNSVLNEITSTVIWLSSLKWAKQQWRSQFIAMAKVCLKENIEWTPTCGKVSAKSWPQWLNIANKVIHYKSRRNADQPMLNQGSYKHFWIPWTNSHLCVLITWGALLSFDRVSQVRFI